MAEARCGPGLHTLLALSLLVEWMREFLADWAGWAGSAVACPSWWLGRRSRNPNDEGWQCGWVGMWRTGSSENFPYSVKEDYHRFEEKDDLLPDPSGVWRRWWPRRAVAETRHQGCDGFLCRHRPGPAGVRAELGCLATFANKLTLNLKRAEGTCQGNLPPAPCQVPSRLPLFSRRHLQSYQTLPKLGLLSRNTHHHKALRWALSVI